ncbi:MAG: hypothetical protein HYX53_11095 [Chloroflexi bacterium]|nr:hypothetical protein [Chloroflexota bacterium]
MKLPWRRRHRVRVDVDPVQLIALRFLLRFGPALPDTLFAEVFETRATPREMFDAAIASLVAAGLAEHRFDPADATTALVLTPLGQRLKGKLPAESCSTIAVYL